MTNGRFSLVGIFCFFALSGCSEPESLVRRVPESCLGAETKIVSRMPIGITMTDTEKLRDISTLARGVYVSDDLVLTVVHALPQAAYADGFVERKRDEDKHLLLLEADICGSPLQLADSELTVEAEVFDCSLGKSLGAIAGFEDTTVSESPLSSFAVMLNDLAILPGSFAVGDSGKPFCNAQGELVALLVAVRDDVALLIGTEQLRLFLN